MDPMISFTGIDPYSAGGTKTYRLLGKLYNKKSVATATTIGSIRFLAYSLKK